MRRLLFVVVAALTLGACASIFGLDPLKLGPDSGVEEDASPDAAPDAADQ
jgi:hypothetical protein